MGSTRTDGSGYYSLQLHLHDTDVSRKLTLRAGKHEATIVVTFDPQDKSSIRTHDANFVDGKLIDQKLDKFRVPSLLYPAAGIFVIFLIAFLLERRRKKKLRLKADSRVAGQSPHSKKKRKGKRTRR